MGGARRKKKSQKNQGRSVTASQALRVIAAAQSHRVASSHTQQTTRKLSTARKRSESERKREREKKEEAQKGRLGQRDPISRRWLLLRATAAAAWVHVRTWRMRRQRTQEENDKRAQRWKRDTAGHVEAQCCGRRFPPPRGRFSLRGSAVATHRGDQVHGWRWGGRPLEKDGGEREGEGGGGLEWEREKAGHA